MIYVDIKGRNMPAPMPLRCPNTGTVRKTQDLRLAYQWFHKARQVAPTGSVVRLLQGSRIIVTDTKEPLE